MVFYAIDCLALDGDAEPEMCLKHERSGASLSSQ